MALLLLNANEVVSTDRLIEELWEGDAPAEDAARTLQVAVSRLRKVLYMGNPLWQLQRPCGEPGGAG